LDRKVLAKDYIVQLLSQRYCSTNKYLIEGCHNKKGNKIHRIDVRWKG